MTESRTEERQNVPKKGTSSDISFESKLHLLFLGLLSIGFVGYFALRKLWIGFVLGHAAALGIMGFYGCLAGAIAKKKQGLSNRIFPSYNFGRHFSFFVSSLGTKRFAFDLWRMGKSSCWYSCRDFLFLRQEKRCQ